MDRTDARRASGGEGAGGRRAPARLCYREAEIARLLASGLTHQEIAEALALSDAAVRGHIEGLLSKTL